MKMTSADEETAGMSRPQPSVPSGEGIKFQKTITVYRAISEVYSFWRNLENLPRFMKHLRSVTVIDELRSHWVISLDEKSTSEWDAEIIEDRVDEMISWRSLPGADVDNAGSVWFKTATGGRGTVVKVALKYSPPGGKFGAAIAKFFGNDAKTAIEKDLLSFKALFETGEIPTIEGQPRGNQD